MRACSLCVIRYQCHVICDNCTLNALHIPWKRAPISLVTTAHSNSRIQVTTLASVCVCVSICSKAHSIAICSVITPLHLVSIHIHMHQEIATSVHIHNIYILICIHVVVGVLVSGSTCAAKYCRKNERDCHFIALDYCKCINLHSTYEYVCMFVSRLLQTCIICIKHFPKIVSIPWAYFWAFLKYRVLISSDHKLVLNFACIDNCCIRSKNLYIYKRSTYIYCICTYIMIRLQSFKIFAVILISHHSWVR